MGKHLDSRLILVDWPVDGSSSPNQRRAIETRFPIGVRMAIGTHHPDRQAAALGKNGNLEVSRLSRQDGQIGDRDIITFAAKEDGRLDLVDRAGAAGRGNQLVLARHQVAESRGAVRVVVAEGLKKFATTLRFAVRSLPT